MEHSDQKTQQKKCKCSAKVVDGKLFLEINDNITYKGQMQSSPYYNINELKLIFQRGDVEILSKTTSKMLIKLGFLTVQLQSVQNLQMQELKKKVQELENKLKRSQWIEEDLNSKDKFDLDYIYKIHVGGVSLISIYHTIDALTFYNGWATQSSDRKANSAGTVTKMMKQKCEHT